MSVYGIIPLSFIFIFLFYGAKFVESNAENPHSGAAPTIHLSPHLNPGSSRDEINPDDHNSPPSLIDLNLDNRFNTNNVQFVKDDSSNTQTFTPTPPFLINTIKKDGKVIWESNNNSYSFKVVVKSLAPGNSTTKIYFTDFDTIKKLKPGESLEESDHQTYSIQFDDDSLSHSEVVHIESDSNYESDTDIEVQERPISETITLSRKHRAFDGRKSRPGPKSSSVVLDLDTDSSNKESDPKVDVRPRPKTISVDIDTDTQRESESETEMRTTKMKLSRRKVVKSDSDLVNKPDDLVNKADDDLINKADSGSKHKFKQKHLGETDKLDSLSNPEGGFDYDLKPAGLTVREIRIDSESNLESDPEFVPRDRPRSGGIVIPLDSDSPPQSENELRARSIPNPRVKEIPLDTDSHAESDIEHCPRPDPNARFQEFELDSDAPETDSEVKPRPRTRSDSIVSERGDGMGLHMESVRLPRPIVKPKPGAKVVKLETDSNHESDLEYIRRRKDRPASKDIVLQSDSSSGSDSDSKPSGKPPSRPGSVKRASDRDDGPEDESKPKSAKLPSDTEDELKVESKPMYVKLGSDKEPEFKPESKPMYVKLGSDKEPEFKPESKPMYVKLGPDKEPEFKPESKTMTIKLGSDRESKYRVESKPRSVKSGSDRESNLKDDSKCMTIKLGSDKEPEFKVEAKPRSIKLDSDKEDGVKVKHRHRSVVLDTDSESGAEGESGPRHRSDFEGEPFKSKHNDFNELEPQVFTVPLVVLDIELKHSTKAIAYFRDPMQRRELFRAIEPYLIQKVVNGNELLWDSKDRTFSNKVIYKQVNGLPRLKVYLAEDVGRLASPYQYSSDQFPTHAVPVGQVHYDKPSKQTVPIILDIHLRYCTVLFDYSTYNNVGTYIPKPEYVFTTVKKNDKLFWFGKDVIIWRSFSAKIYSKRVDVFGDNRVIIYLNDGNRVYFKRGNDLLWYKLDKSQYYHMDWDPDLVELDIKKKGSTQFYEFFEYQDYFHKLSSRWLFRVKGSNSIKQVQDGNTVIWKARRLDECASSVRVYKSLGGMEHVALFLKNGSGRSFIKLGFTFGLGGTWVEEAKMFNYDNVNHDKPPLPS